MHVVLLSRSPIYTVQVHGAERTFELEGHRRKCDKHLTDYGQPALWDRLLCKLAVSNACLVAGARPDKVPDAVCPAPSCRSQQSGLATEPAACNKSIPPILTAQRLLTGWDGMDVLKSSTSLGPVRAANLEQI